MNQAATILTDTELLRADIAQSAVPARSVVVFNVLEDGLSQRLSIYEALAMNQLNLQGMELALGRHVIIAVPVAPHAAAQVESAQVAADET